MLSCDMVKEMLHEAYSANSVEEMTAMFDNIVEICSNTDNRHILWFAKLLENHKEGIINHAVFRVSTGK